MTTNNPYLGEVPHASTKGQSMPIRLVIFLSALITALELLIGTLYPELSTVILTLIGLQTIMVVIVVSVMGRRAFKTDKEFKRDCAKACKHKE